MSQVICKLTHFFQPTVGTAMFTTLLVTKITDIYCAFFERNLYFMNMFNRDKYIKEIYAFILIILYPPFYVFIIILKYFYLY